MDFAQQILDAGSIKLDFGYKLKVLSERLSQCTSFLHFFLCRPASIRLSTLHSIRIRLLTLALDLWKGKHLGLATLQTFPHEQVIPICPHQRSDPWLHIPSQIQRRALHIGDAPRRIRDLVFRPLIIQFDNAWLFLAPVHLSVIFLRSALPSLGRFGKRCGRRVDPLVLVPGSQFRR